MIDKRFTYDKPLVAFSKGGINDNVTGETYEFTMDTVLDLLNAQSETIRKQSIRIYCQDKEIQRLLGELEKIPKSIREVWLEE